MARRHPSTPPPFREGGGSSTTASREPASGRFAALFHRVFLYIALAFGLRGGGHLAQLVQPAAFFWTPLGPTILGGGGGCGFDPHSDSSSPPSSPPCDVPPSLTICGPRHARALAKYYPNFLPRDGPAPGRHRSLPTHAHPPTTPALMASFWE